MKKGTLGVYTFVHNLVEYDYPFFESLSSYIPIADKIVICECESTDGTVELLRYLKLLSPKIEIVSHNWVKDYKELSNLGNYTSLFLDTEWMWQIQADEVLHEKDYKLIRSLVDGSLPDNITALKVNYNHFFGNYETQFPFCYQSLIRISRKGKEWKLIGDACELSKFRSKLSEILETNITVFHYGKVHEGRVGFKKEVDFQSLYKELNFPDPKLEEMRKKFGEDYCDYIYLFENVIKEGKIWKFQGTHPLVMKDRIKRFKGGGWEQFKSRFIEGLEV